METLIRFVLTNFTLTFAVLGLVASSVAILRAPQPRRPGLVVEKLLAWFVFFNIGAAFLYNFVLHSFFGEMTTRLIGWADSPFQFEVGTAASLGFALVGFYAAFRGFEARVAAILGPAAFLWGAAAGHVREMIAAANFAPGNAGMIFWTDILVPLAGFALLWAARRPPQSAASAGERSPYPVKRRT